MITLASVQPIHRPAAASTDGRQIEMAIGRMHEPTYKRWYDSSLICGPITPFFTLAMNQMDPLRGRHKTKVDTNMTAPGQFLPPYCCIAAQIGFQINGEQGLIDDFYSKCWFEFKVLGKPFAEGRLWRYQQGDGYIDPETGEFQNTLPFHYRDRQMGLGELGEFSAGLPVPQAGIRPSPIYISPLTQFVVQLYAPDYQGPQLEVIAYLDGITDIPIC